MISLFGEVRLVCSYYHCRHCRTGQQPWDEALRLGARRVTAGAEEAIALAGLLTSFGRAAQSTLRKLTGIRVSESTVLRVTEDAGQTLGQRRQAKETFGPQQSWAWQKDARGQRCAYLSLDHVSVPQQGPGGAKAESRMAAVAMIYNPQSAHDEQHPRGGCPVRFLAGLYELDQLGLDLRRQAAQVDWDAAEQQLALSDAGQGLEDFAAKNFPLAEPILDFYHASEHVAALAAAVHPDDAPAVATLTKDWCHRLKHEGGAALLAAWEALDVSRWRGWRSEVYRQQVQYFRNHQHRMDYPRYVAHGWQIGSGPVESGCKRLVTQRLKGAGMRWGPRGTDTMCHLRALLLSHPDQWDDYWT
ncbi:MAG: ISKra4 family transposase, partial [Candidatus Acidiferrales bacterium]